jgi:hypothetical protein
MKKSKATKTAANTPETKTAAKTSVKAKYVLAKNAENRQIRGIESRGRSHQSIEGRKENVFRRDIGRD